jgi:DNA-binding GntR family transcriptional regulator
MIMKLPEKAKVWAAADVLSKLRSEILSGDLPPMSRLRFSELQERFQVGIGTLREALAHVETEGFVESEAGRGYRVAPISVDDLNDIVELRVELETSALESALANGDTGWEAEIVAAFHRLYRLETLPVEEQAKHEDAWAACHRDFHMSLVAACTSRWTLRFHSILFDQAHRYRMVSRRLRDGSSSRVSEHKAIMEAVIARDVKAALELSERHIRKTAEIIAKRLADSDQKGGAFSAPEAAKRTRM